MRTAKDENSIGENESYCIMNTEDVDVTAGNTVNILIIGETGVGKSTFINAFANYLRFESLEEVENEQPLVLIPCKFTVTDENYDLREVKIGSDENENDELGKSATQDPRTYTFSISSGEKFVSLIDTPGLGDTRGIDQDTKNCEKIINYIAPLKVIHGILFLLKPNSSKITVLFEFCMKQILSRLEKSASNNLLFTFTNTRGTCYRPGETLPCLRRVLEDISKRPPYVNIPLSKDNIFCLDNEAFRYLAAIANGVQFTRIEKQYFSESWKKSAEESWRMIIRITGDANNKPLEPHRVEHTICVNEARDVINKLKKPMADITELIQDKLRALQRQTELLEVDNSDLKHLRKLLVIPIIDIEIKELSKPATVCTSSKCAKIYKVRDVTKWHYKQRCHDPCSLKKVPEKIIGDPELLKCSAMNDSRECKRCGCCYSTHMHIYYESKTVDKTIENVNVKKTIFTKEGLKKEKVILIREMHIITAELEREHKIIIHHIAKFAHFLQQNAITPYNDVYGQYIDYLIDRENLLGDVTDKNKVLNLKKYQQEYEEAKRLFDTALSMTNESSVLTPATVQESVDELFKLKHTGKKIEQLYLSQNLSTKSELMYSNANSQKQADKKVIYGRIGNYSSKVMNYSTGTPIECKSSSKVSNNKRKKMKKNIMSKNNRKHRVASGTKRGRRTYAGGSNRCFRTSAALSYDVKKKSIYNRNCILFNYVLMILNFFVTMSIIINCTYNHQIIRNMIEFQQYA